MDIRPRKYFNMTTTNPRRGETSTATLEEQEAPALESKISSGERETGGDRKPSEEDGEEARKSRNTGLGIGRLFGFGKKKKEEGEGNDILRENGKGMETEAGRDHPSNLKLSHSTHPYLAQSPGLLQHDFTSTRVVSPAGSQIFERDVQETVSTVLPASPAIPSHIQTENHIPAVLDASSEAITDKDLNPDTVEIVMHSSHQPAVMTVTGMGSSEATSTHWSDELAAHPDKDDATSNYGAFDNTDVRRLSFISFADVVQSEQAEHFNNSREPAQAASLTGRSSTHRSPSPIRSVGSAQVGGASSPASKSACVKGEELLSGGSGRLVASPTLSVQTPPPHAPPSELTIETMSQALRKSRSGDLAGAKSQTMSPTSPVDEKGNFS